MLELGASWNRAYDPTSLYIVCACFFHTEIWNLLSAKLTEACQLLWLLPRVKSLHTINSTNPEKKREKLTKFKQGTLFCRPTRVYCVHYAVNAC